MLLSWANRGPGATCGPTNCRMRPAEPHNRFSRCQRFGCQLDWLEKGSEHPPPPCPSAGMLTCPLKHHLEPYPSLVDQFTGSSNYLLSLSKLDRATHWSQKTDYEIAAKLCWLLCGHNYLYSVRFYIHLFKEILWDLGGLSRARFPLNDKDLVLVDGREQVLSVGEDGKAASHLLHGLFLQLRLGKSRSFLLLREKTEWKRTKKKTKQKLKWA